MSLRQIHQDDISKFWIAQYIYGTDDVKEFNVELIRARIQEPDFLNFAYFAPNQLNPSIQPLTNHQINASWQEICPLRKRNISTNYQKNAHLNQDDFSNHLRLVLSIR